jgi:ligand-binding sensor domain-containing protein/DNA-binding CsgD family transcriptional regulator
MVKVCFSGFLNYFYFLYSRGIMLKIRRFILMALIILSAEVTGLSEIKDIGTPYIRNFTRHEYRAGNQNWGVSQDQKGFMYFANNAGLLVFDGVQWQTYRMPNLSMVRSIYIDKKGEIFIGAYNEVGKMVHGPGGRLEYFSLKNKIPAEFRNFDDVWNVLPYDNKIVFQSYNGAYVYEEGKDFSFIPAPVRFPGAYNVEGRLFFYDSEQGVFEFNGTSMIPLNGCEDLAGMTINSILPFKEENQILICTLDKGLFLYNGTTLTPWNVPVNELLKEYQIFSAVNLHDQNFAFGTIQDGLIIADYSGNLIQHINKKVGLQNNTILKEFCDRTGNLWLALDNGIDYVNINSPVTFLNNPEGFGAGYAELIHNGKLYLGTNQGLYVRDWDNGKSKKDFKMIPGTHGQVWSLVVLKGILLCGHDHGTFIIDNESARQINNTPGGWKYLIPNKHPDYLIGGTYSGLIRFKWVNDTWVFDGKISGFGESFRVFEEDENGDLWMSHGFKGIYRIRLSMDLEKVTDSRYFTMDDGLPSNYNLNVYKIRGRIIFTSGSGIYEYNAGEDRFAPFAYFNMLLRPLKSISYLKEDDIGNIWYVSNGTAGVFRIQDNFSLQQVTVPFTLLSDRFINGFESIYPFSEDHIFFGIEDGFAHYSAQARLGGYQEFSTYITLAENIALDSAFFFGNSNLKSESGTESFLFPFRYNSFRFSYSAPVYDNSENIEYSYKLAGYNENWSRWTNSWNLEYSHLPSGKFVFMVKARNQLGIESPSDSFEFIVLSPWYKSVVAMICYGIILVLSVFLGNWIVNRRIEISKKKERIKQIRLYHEKEQEYVKQAILAEKEIIIMKNEKLRSDMIQQDKALANQAMSIVRKNEFLNKIKEDLVSLRNASHEEHVNEKILSIISRVNREVGHNKQREVFDKAFDEVHESFLTRLKTKYPSLTPTELRLCAFLKMNISTKEIAPLMNISVRGVEICRYRVRKKLKIGRDTNLTGLLLNL